MARRGRMSDNTSHSLPACALGIDTQAVADAGSRKGRRRLWHLPTQAHELLLATSFTPDMLRREAARMLGHMHQGVCILKGGDVDVLYSLVHDMGTRNPLSEAFQKRLDERHAIVLRRMALQRDAAALQSAWTQALAGDTLPAALWSLLTHPLGAALEGSALYDARAWVFAHCRRSVALEQAQTVHQDSLRAAADQIEALRARLSAQQQQAATALVAARTENIRLVGELARQQRTLDDPALPAPDLRPQGPDQRGAPAWAPGAKPETPVPARALVPQRVAMAVEPVNPARALPPPVIADRRVLCVGGIQHAVARYRSRIERLGGYFEHHDGGLEDSVQALDGRLRRAEVVICQAACINHEAYHRVKRHCERTGTPCLYLERPSLSALDRALKPR